VAKVGTSNQDRTVSLKTAVRSCINKHLTPLLNLRLLIFGLMPLCLGCAPRNCRKCLKPTAHNKTGTLCARCTLLQSPYSLRLVQTTWFVCLSVSLYFFLSLPTNDTTTCPIEERKNTDTTMNVQNSNLNGIR